MKLNYYLGLIILVFLTSCKFDYLNYYQHIDLPNSKFYYALYTDNADIGDIEFDVLRIEKSINPKELNLKWSLNKRDTIAENWIKDRKILSNYEEGSSLTNNANIKILNNRFLVFSRGNLYFALYDLVADSAVVDFYSPWHGWVETVNHGPDYRSDVELENKLYKAWIEKNLQNPIKDYIKKNK